MEQRAELKGTTVFALLSSERSHSALFKKNAFEMFFCDTQTTAKKHLIGEEVSTNNSFKWCRIFSKYLTGKKCCMSKLHFPEVSFRSNSHFVLQ